MLRLIPAAGCFLCLTSMALAQLTTQPAIPSAENNSRPTRSSSSDTCHFQYRPAQPGEKYRQQVEYGVDLTTQIRQSGQVVSDSQQRLLRKQQRQVEVLPPPSGVKSSVRVTFDEALQRIGGPDGKLQDIPQPVQGRTYVVSRSDGRALTIENADGTSITTEERKIINTAMDAVGRSNPLGQFLHGKSIQVGQPIELPKAVAASMFSAGGKSGPEDIERFVLKLRKIGNAQNGRIASFDTAIIMRDTSHADGQVQISGQMTLDAQSCRALSTDIAGPLHITEQRGPKQAQFTVEGRGHMKLATQTQFVLNDK